MREGIKKKAAAQHRKNRKEAKKDVTWKSRKPKDPGIPASFPYKDRIISELEESRRADKEKKEQQRLQKQLEREEALARGEEVMEDNDEDDIDDGNGLGALLESAQKAAKEYDGEPEETSDMEVSDEDVEYNISEPEIDEDAKTEWEQSRKLSRMVLRLPMWFYMSWMQEIQKPPDLVKWNKLFFRILVSG